MKRTQWAALASIALLLTAALFYTPAAAVVPVDELTERTLDELTERDFQYTCNCECDCSQRQTDIDKIVRVLDHVRSTRGELTGFWDFETGEHVTVIDRDQGIRKQLREIQQSFRELQVQSMTPVPYTVSAEPPAPPVCDYVAPHSRFCPDDRFSPRSCPRPPPPPTRP